MLRPPDSLAVFSDDVGRWSLRIGDGSDPATGAGPHTSMRLRGAPIAITSMSDTDPFGPGEATLSLPMVSPLEPIGLAGSELWFLRPEAPVTITFAVTSQVIRDALAAVKLPALYSWRGFINEFSWSSDQNSSGLTIGCIGALRVLDQILSKPVAVSRPIPYETAILAAINFAMLGLGEPRLSMMAPLYMHGIAPGSGVIYKASEYENLPLYRQPLGLVDGQQWSGMLTRTAGNWDKVLSEYVAGLLAMMYTDRGRFTIDLDTVGWFPVWKHINMFGHVDDAQVLRVNAAWPGVGLSLESDYSQTLNTVYGSVTSSLSGTMFNNQQWSTDGTVSWFEPFASTKGYGSTSVDRPGQRREQHLEFMAGLQPYVAKGLARLHVDRNREPGLTGSVTLTATDPLIFDTPRAGQGAGGELVTYPKHLIKAGMTMQLDGLHGRIPGPRLFITEVQRSPMENSVTLQVDSKYRDYKTVEEVQLRGRDALKPLQLMTASAYDPIVQDSLLPWDYTQSGTIPVWSHPLWSRWMDDPDFEDQSFPWTGLTKRFPPKQFPQYYIKIAGDEKTRRFGKENGQFVSVEPAPFWSFYGKGTRVSDTSAANNTSDPGNEKNGLTRLSFAGTISGIRIMCVDDDGKVLPVNFHVMLSWAVQAGAHTVSPLLFNDWRQDSADGRPIRFYKKGTPYPFAPFAFSPVNLDGSTSLDPYRVNPAAGIIRGSSQSRV